MNKLNWKSDLSGMKFHLLTVVSKDRQDKKGSYWLCECECGNTKIIRYDALLNGRTKSCGCLSKIGKNKGSYRHGLHNSKIYSTYYGMRQRCENKNSSDYSYYGGRGITVCEEWKIFENFYKWSLENGYEENLMIDRIDNNKGYSPDNCRWVTRLTQQNNKRNNHREMVNGELISMREASNKYGISYSILRGRVYSGMTMQEAIYFEEKKNMKITIDGETKTLREWCEIYGNNRSTVWTRISRGWNPERAIKTTENVRGKTNLYSTPFVSKYQITINGVTKSLADWCRETGVNPRVARRRININHWNPADAVTIKPKYGLKYEKVAIWGNSQDNQK